ncbi:cupin domain-containing protein [Blastopirellula retiformator]|nr:cupin domain-containing protein [Blastopirellula retiformator]
MHRREEESFYVLYGEITFTLEDEQIIAGPGCFLTAC